MNPSSSTPLTPSTLLGMVVRYRWLLIAPAIVGAVLAAASTYLIEKDWRADQGLLIRSDAAGYANQRLGKFTDLSEMKTVQETLLELARSRSVVAAVLKETETELAGREPTPEQISKFRDKLRFTPPGGAEFGKTEVFYLGVLDPKPTLAITKVESLTRQLELRMQTLRDQRATSMVSEVERSSSLAEEQLQVHIETLAKFEKNIGADLSELRHLIASNGGQSDLGQRALAIQAEQRQSITQRRQNKALLDELSIAINDPTRLLITPDTLLTRQPGLRRLKNGLVSAQLNVANLSGIRTDDHPYVKAARETQQRIYTELRRELPSTLASVNLEISVAKQQEAARTAELDKLREKTIEIASYRSEYSKLSANVRGQTQVLEGVLQQLSDARSHKVGAASASLLARLDAAELSVYPIGPGRTTVTAAGGMAGLILGGVLMVMFVSPQPKHEAKAQQFATRTNRETDAQNKAPWAFETEEDASQSSATDLSNVWPEPPADLSGGSYTVGV